jgi:hypothetical protein
LSDETTEPPKIGTSSGLAYTESASAPFIFFDGVACYGSSHGIVEIELAARIMSPRSDGGVQVQFVPAGRLRCSLAAAAALRSSIDASIKMAEQPQQQPPPAATSKLN